MMKKDIKDSFGMFSLPGDMAVGAILNLAIENKRNWGYVLAQLIALSKVDGFNEALDTEVRECAWSVMAEAELA